MKTDVAEVAVELALHGRWAEAADLNRRIVERTPDDVRARNRLARALEALGRTADARHAYAAALARDPHDRIAAGGLARLAGGPPSTGHQSRPLDYGRLERRVDEPPEVQYECLEPYEEYETEEPERAVAERIELAAELAQEARLEHLEGAPGLEALQEEAEQRRRDRALAAEEEIDRR
jgi:tetratricopeptide (TPR) repeat protein